VAVSTGVPAKELQALMDLYNAMGGSKWKNRKNWGGRGSPCTWFGVRCSSNHVVRVVLPNNGLVGTIPSSIGNLPNLM
jgi:hypothetical protein